jgi:N-methylhydantoinase A
MATLVAEAAAELTQQGYTSGLEAQRGLEMRYLGQNYELELPIGVDALDDGAVDRLWESFHAAHEARFGFAIPGDIIEIVTYTVTATSRTVKPELHRLPPAESPPVPVAERRVLFVAGEETAPVYRRDDLRAGDTFAGPALVEEAASVTVVEPGQRLTVDAFGHLLIVGA